MAERVRVACEAWALQGYGAPLGVYGFYLVKLALYVGGWLLACAQSPELGGPAEIAQWWAHPLAFQKAIAWSMAFEVLGWGCGSGPLTGRYWPPLVGVLHFARPGTTRLPFLERAPGLRGVRRSFIDVALYLGLLGGLLTVCFWGVPPTGAGVPPTGAGVPPSGAGVPPTGGEGWFWGGIAVLGVLAGLRDRTIFLAARGEHYWATIVVFALAADTAGWIAGAKIIALALWFWAGVSKLNAHFPAVVGVMVSNSPLTRFAWLRRRMYQKHPEDLRPSKLAKLAAHGGAALEFGVPLIFATQMLGPELGLAPASVETLTSVGIVAMLALHLYITSNVPMGVPIEWNVAVVYGGLFLFVGHPEVGLSALTSDLTSDLINDPSNALAATFALASAWALPLVGNLWPARVSFLPSMRYYAGNWAYSVWLFAEGAHQKLERKLVKSAPWLEDQLRMFYDEGTVQAVVSKVLAFRVMHLHGRAMGQICTRPEVGLEDIEARTWVDGELIAGLTLGWNFGDGHLHDDRLLRALQAQCGFAPGELRCVFVESQPMFNGELAWRVHDAAQGELARGAVEVADLIDAPPWPT